MAETTNQLKKRQEKEFKKRLGDYLATFTSAHGRRVLKDMRASYCGHIASDGTLKVGMALGKREVIKDIEAMLITAKNPQAVEDLFRKPEDDGFEL